MIFDTHCHPYLSKERNENDVLLNLKNNGNIFINSVGTNLENSKHCIELAGKYDFCFASIGVHPCDIGLYNSIENTILEIEELLKNQKIIAIGECGLDYYRINEDRIQEEKINQKLYFKAQIYIAKKYNLPLIIHNREAGNDIFKILKETNFKNFIMHCFSEDLDYAKKLIKFSPKCKISFSGIVTFNSAQKIQETAKNIPLENIIIETDSPYLSPIPYRGKENYPEYTQNILNKIVELRNESFEEIENKIWKNSLEIFNIKKDF